MAGIPATTSKFDKANREYLHIQLTVEKKTSNDFVCVSSNKTKKKNRERKKPIPCIECDEQRTKTAIGLSFNWTKSLPPLDNRKNLHTKWRSSFDRKFTGNHWPSYNVHFVCVIFSGYELLCVINFHRDDLFLKSTGNISISQFVISLAFCWDVASRPLEIVWHRELSHVHSCLFHHCSINMKLCCFHCFALVMLPYIHPSCIPPKMSSIATAVAACCECASAHPIYTPYNAMSVQHYIPHRVYRVILGWSEPIVCLCTYYLVYRKFYRLTSLRYFALFLSIYVLHPGALSSSRYDFAPLPFIFVYMYTFLCTYIARFFDMLYQKCERFHVFNAIWMYVEILLVTSVRRILEGKQIKCNPTKYSKRERAKFIGIMQHTNRYTPLRAKRERERRVRKHWNHIHTETNGETEKRYSTVLFGWKFCENALPCKWKTHVSNVNIAKRISHLAKTKLCWVL